MDITDSLTVETRFLDTYAREGELHPYRQYEQYDLVMTHRERHQHMGRRRIAEHIDVPAGRIAGWLKGSKPTGYETFQTVRDRGWFDLEWEGETFTSLNTLVAWILSGGALNESYMPMFSVEPESIDVCTAALGALDVEYNEIRDDDSQRGPEVRPVGDPATLGRLLAALGTPTGAKAQQRFGLPPYLAVAPEGVRRDFAQVYLLNRGTDVARGYEQGIREERRQFYLGQLAALFQSVTDGEIVYTSDYMIYFDGQAVSEVLGEEAVT